MKQFLIKRSLRALFAVAGGLILGLTSATADSTYGSGNYGSCQYGSCGITVSSSTTVNLNINPVPGGSCTIQSDSVAVLTDNTNGYTLTVNMLGPNTNLVNGSNNIAASSGTYASPTALSNGKWGYRVDGLGSFSAGTTTAQSNVSPGSINTITFAGMVSSNATAVTLANTSAPADPAQTTLVWYGACVDVTQAQGTYTGQVTYTATTN